MHRTMPLVVALAVIAVALSGGLAVAGDVNIGVTIGVPRPPVVVAPPAVVIAPPPVILVPPPLVIVPGTAVHRDPTASFNVFVYGKQYYSFHNGAWFVAAGHGAPWTIIAIESVPAPVRAVPVKHYKIPPGHAKQMDAHEAGCPPGQAKKGRC